MSTQPGRARPFWIQESVYVFCAILAGFGVAIALNHLLDGAVVERAQRDVSRTLEHLSRQVLEAVDAGRDPGNLLQREAEVLGVRLTLIAPDGQVLADSNVDRRRLAQVENHGTRPEVLQAKSAGVGFDRRLSATVAEPFVYVAYRLDRGGALAGYLRGAVSEREIYRAEAPFRRRLLAVSSLTGFLAGLLILSIRRRHFDELHLLRESIQQASLGEIPHPAGQTSADAAEILASLHDLVRRVRNEEERTRRHEEILDSVLAEIPDGVVVAARDLSILTSNEAAASLLGISTESLAAGRHVLEAFRDARFSGAFESALERNGEAAAQLDVHGQTVGVRVNARGAGETRFAIAVLTRG